MASNTSSSGPSNRWIPVVRDYEKELQIGILKSKTVTEHPLSENFVKESVLQTSSTKIVNQKSVPTKNSDPLSTIDPLSSQQFNPLQNVDETFKPTPTRLSTIISKPILSQSNSSLKSEVLDDTFISWNSKKIPILQEFTTNESIGITVSFMEGVDLQGKFKLPVDKTQQRLAQLEESEQAQKNKTVQVSQKGYEKSIESLHEDLIKAWNNEERVKSLKIAIQCAKLLSDTSVVKFYPSKFVLITEILDTFGKLVYERIASRTEGKSKSKTFDKTDFISDQTKETCRNWFYKIASIRELLPRLYVEMAIIKSYNFIQHSSFASVISRISKMIRGIGDPLVASYCRAYLARKGHEVEPSYKDYLIQGFYDDINLQNSIKGKIEDIANRLSITQTEYLNLFSPSIDWQLQCIGHIGTQDILNDLLKKYKETNNPFILKYIISSFPPQLIAPNARDLVLLIKEAPEGVPKYQLYSALGVNLVLGEPPKDIHIPLLNEIWKSVTKIEDTKEYISVAVIYIEYPLKYCTPREVNILLGDILKHVKEGLAYEKLQGPLQSIISKILSSNQDFDIIFAMENFLPILDLFTGDSLIEVNKGILSSFIKSGGTTSDPIIVNTIFTIGKNVHDSINSLTFPDEIRQISKLISSFVGKVDYGIDLEKHLNFFVECRRAFTNLDSVKYPLIIGACNLAMKALKIVKGKHTKKTAAFVRACIAYCFISIPSMEDFISRLNLYLLSAEIALMNQAPSQADSLLKSAIKLLQEVPCKIEIDGQTKSSEEQIINISNNFLSLLVAVPGHPEQGPFYLVKGILKVISEYPWETGSTAKIRIYMSILVLFSTYYQPKFPYQFSGVDTNEVLYGGDPDYIKEIQSLITKVLDDTLEELSKFNEKDELGMKNQSKLALDLFNYILFCAELNAKSATLAFNLFVLIKKSGDLQPYITNSLNYLKTKESSLSKELLKKLTTI